MSGYGGQPPPGWEDPYGGSQGYGAAQGYGSGYGPAGYDTPGYGAPPPGYGPPGVPHGSGGSNASTIVALVLNSVFAVLCCNVLTIPGIVTSAIALGKASTDPGAARTLTMWSWVIFGVAMALGLLFFILLIVAGVFSDDGGQSGYSGTTGI